MAVYVLDLFVEPLWISRNALFIINRISQYDSFVPNSTMSAFIPATLLDGATVEPMPLPAALFTANDDTTKNGIAHRYEMNIPILFPVDPVFFYQPSPTHRDYYYYY